MITAEDPVLAEAERRVQEAQERVERQLALVNSSTMKVASTNTGRKKRDS
jgi:hypothetical protein